MLDGDFERSLAATEEARRMAIGADLHQALARRRPRARSLAGVGRLDEAEHLARESLDIVEATDYLLGRGEARVVLAEVLLAGGKVEHALRAANEGVALLEAKGATVLAKRARAVAADPGRGAPVKRLPSDGTHRLAGGRADGRHRRRGLDRCDSEDEENRRKCREDQERQTGASDRHMHLCHLLPRLHAARLEGGPETVSPRFPNGSLTTEELGLVTGPDARTYAARYVAVAASSEARRGSKGRN